MNKYEVAESIHRKANFDTQYINDQLQYGVPEFWTIADSLVIVKIMS